MKTEVTQDPDQHKLTFTRVFDQPQDKVFAAFANLDQLEKWWTPPGFHPETETFDFKVGGTWHYCAVGMFGDEKIESWTKRDFTEIVPGEKIVVHDGFSNPEGTISQDMPQSTQTFEFSDEGEGKTKLVVTAEYDSDEGYNKVLELEIVTGIDETLSQLEELLNK